MIKWLLGAGAGVFALMAAFFGVQSARDRKKKAKADRELAGAVADLAVQKSERRTEKAHEEIVEDIIGGDTDDAARRVSQYWAERQAADAAEGLTDTD